MSSFLKIVLPALALTGSVYAQSNGCSVSGTKTIQNSGDATALSSCSTFSGSIAIATGTTDDIALNGIKKLDGNLVATSNSNMKRISADSLEEVDGSVELDGLTRLYAVDMPKLKTVETIKWNALPNLQTIGFTAEVTKADNIRIENTALRSLSGINIEKADTIFVANNGYINEINMQIGNVSDSLTFADNNEKLAVTLPNLIWATNLTFRFIGSLSMPSLETLNGSLGLYNNGFESFSAPNLTSIGEALAIVANEGVSNISFPQLTKITDNLQIANNTNLSAIDGFPKLTSIGGAFDISGNMSTVETPELDSVKGAFNLQSTGNITEACAFYKPLQEKKLIQGKYFCQGKLVDPSTAGSKPTSQSGSDSKTGAATSLSAVNGALGLAAMAAVFLL
ncbi:GPI-anchored cell wall organization protein Ecm33 [Didymella exigua CBS 183.55]|uniref:GPI-anchored cell wall organization protein Ecm33 n=1 Tax=Didymella exigua CBS 183.55 TaxID=1150837 RepID=A0A6A5RR00_9PLEO|nr:GPI-anchored cell wall organization protein Ecm33 [Didymella exigua CBS 183.55]KAF1928736.1 GPI-anchored cell wall organization protein Ecm33 [Didymella exigua CBS 183.55]